MKKNFPNNEDIQRFIDLTKEFIEAEKKIDKSDYACKDDLSYLYRFISSSCNAWKVLAEWRKDEEGD